MLEIRAANPTQRIPAHGSREGVHAGAFDSNYCEEISVMTLVRYVPYNGHGFGDVFNQLHRQINRAFDTHAAASNADSAATADWVPPADVAEFGDRFVLRLDVPGVDIGAISITLDQGVLSIGGERANDAPGEEVERSRVERPQGRFHRRFTLPDTVDAAGVKATSRAGILEIVIPKQAKVQPRRIEVAAA
jgi:HSP20 family protein